MVLANNFFYERIQLDTINERFNKMPTAKEGDANGRGLIVVLTENGLVKNTTGVDLLLKWEHTRVEGAQGLEPFEALDLTKGEYIVTYPTDMNHEGFVKAEIRIIDNGKYAGSRNMKIQVEPSVGDDTAIESSNEFTALVTALVKTNHMENLLNEAIANVTVDSEVITARNSTAKGKTFTVLDERIEEIEDDTYFPATNALVSPDFEAITGWTADKATLAVANNVASVTGNGTDAYANLYQSNTNVAVIGDKVYLRVRARVTNALCTSLQLSTTSFAQPVFINNPVANQWYDIYVVIDATATNAILTIRANYADAATANGKVLQVEKPVKINLTTAFGNLTPTVDQMYSLMSQFTDGHFAGTASLSQPALVLAKTLSMEAQFNEAIAGVTVDSETINARVGEDSTTHATLKARLDSEKSTIDNSLVSLTSQLADIETLKVDKNGSGQITWAMAAQDFREQITGGNTAVVGVNGVIEETITDKATTERKTSFIKDDKNIWTNGSDVSYTVAQTGSWKSVTYTFTDFAIGDYFTLAIDSVLNNADDVFAQFISYRADGTTAVKVNNFKFSENTKHAKLPITDVVASFKVILFAAQATSIVGGTVVKWKNVRLVKNGDLTYKLSPTTKVTPENLHEDFGITTEQTDFFTPEFNLYDPTKRTSGYYLARLTNAVTADANQCYSEYIPVKPKTTYYKKYYGGVNYSDIDNVFMSGADTGTAESTYTTPEGCYYVQINVVGSANFEREIFAESGADHSFYMPVGTKYLKTEYIDTRQLNGWYNKKFTSFGHSLVGMNTWQKQIADHLGMTHVNCGIGGSTVAGTHGTTGSNPMWTDARINAIPTDTDIIVMLCGFNDYIIVAAGNLGTLGSTDTETFYGAYETVLAKLYARCPNARIVIMTDLFRKDQQGMNNEIYYSINDAIRIIANRYHYPIINSDDFGFNRFNHAVFYQDDVHPNAEGGNRIADVTIGRLKGLAPYYSNYN